MVGGSISVLFIMSCALCVVMLGLGVHDPHHVSASDHNKDLFISFCRAAGEELGWRSYLLPYLVATCSSANLAALISGVVWG